MSTGDIEAAFAAQRDALVRDNARSLRAETEYFLSHEARFLNDLTLLTELCSDGQVLELGAFPFFFTAILAELGRPVVAVDLHPFRLTGLLKRHKLQVVSSDVERTRLPFADASFDCVLLNEMFEHLRIDPQFALSEANRVLKPGGRLMLTTPNLYFIKTVLRFLIGRGFNDPVWEFTKLRRLGHMGHVREYSAAEVRRFLQASGFAVARHAFKQYSYPGGLFGLAARPLLALVPFLRGYNVFIAEKIGPGPLLKPLASNP